MRTNPASRLARDAGLRRVQSITRWTLAGALAGTGLFAGLAAKSVLPVKVAGTKTRVARVPSSGTRSRRDDGGGDDGFQLPQALPTQTVPTQSAPTVLPASPGANTPLVSGAS